MSDFTGRWEASGSGRLQITPDELVGVLEEDRYLSAASDSDLVSIYRDLAEQSGTPTFRVLDATGFLAWARAELAKRNGGAG